MQAFGAAMLILLASSAAVGQIDPLRAPECLAALAELGKAEDAAMVAKAAGSPQAGSGRALTAARRMVGATCLGSAVLAPPPARFRQPVAVGSSAPAVAIAPRPLGTPGAPAPASLPTSLVTLSGCDPAGCWASDGTRLLRQGSLLLGSRGYCTAVGAVLTCP